MRNLAIYSALLACCSGLFLITSWALSPGLGDSLIVPFTGLVFLALVFPLFVGAMALGRVELLGAQVKELEQKVRILGAQIPAREMSGLPGLPQIGQLVSRSNQQTPEA
jgi:hypothetical protein